jgi:chromosome partitioning protein
MNVIVFASRKGGSGKSTLAAHLAAHVHKLARPVLLVDADQQGSLTLWHRLRSGGAPSICSGTDGVADIIKAAQREGYEWTFVDTPPNTSAIVTDAIHAATLVIIPARLTVFDIAAIKETMDLARALRKPYAVVINGVPARRDNTESPYVREARQLLGSLNVPVWAGQITQRTTYSLALAEGEGASEYDERSEAASEVTALWGAIAKSVTAIHGAYKGAAMHRVAA